MGGEAKTEAIAGRCRLVSELIGKMSEEPNTLAADPAVFSRSERREFRCVQRIKKRRFVFDDKMEKALARHGEAYRYGPIIQASVSVADDVREGFLQTKIDGELNISRYAVTRSESFDPDRKLSHFGEPAAEREPVLREVDSIRHHEQHLCLL